MRKEEDLVGTYSPLNGLRRLFSHLSVRRRWQLAGLIVAMMLGAVAELATLGAVLPFLALLAARHQARIIHYCKKCLPCWAGAAPNR